MVMKPLMNRVHPDDRLLWCYDCKDNVIPELEMFGVDILATCPSCDHSLKFVTTQLYQEPRWNDND